MTRRRQRAHTLVETLIALVLAAFVLAAAMSLYRVQRSVHGASVEAAHVRDAATTALELIAQSIRLAGFAPIDWPRHARFLPLFGCTAARPAGDAWLPDCTAAMPGSDGLLVRFVGDTISTSPTASGLVTDCLGQGVGQASAHPLVVNRYFVRTSGSTGEPELYCEGSGRPGIAQPLVEGVERLRLRYWLRDRREWRDASSIAGEAWAGVLAVEVCVQVRGMPSASATRFVDCSGSAQAVRDGRPRWIARRWFALRNPVADRGAPA